VEAEPDPTKNETGKGWAQEFREGDRKSSGKTKNLRKRTEICPQQESNPIGGLYGVSKGKMGCLY